jgi:hypothetical protein
MTAGNEYLTIELSELLQRVDGGTTSGESLSA